MRHYLSTVEENFPSHEQFYGGYGHHHHGWGIWQLISLIVGLLLLCFLIGIAIQCCRNTAYGATGVAPVYY